jgi:hypothetical protein
MLYGSFQVDVTMEITAISQKKEKVTWFSMWFLASIAILARVFSPCSTAN